MDHIPDEDEASHGVVNEAKDAGEWVSNGGPMSQRKTIVAKVREILPDPNV